jgi:hypothetical protein
LSVLPFRIENVSPSKSLEFFLSAQHWMDAFPPPRQPHYARLCTYLKTQLAAEPARPALPTLNAAAGPIAQAFDSAELLHVERQLAGFIGPLARHLVKTAASHAAGVDDLVSRLAMELDTESERREFTQRCRIGKPRD